MNNKIYPWTILNVGSYWSLAALKPRLDFAWFKSTPKKILQTIRLDVNAGWYAEIAFAKCRYMATIIKQSVCVKAFHIGNNRPPGKANMLWNIVVGEYDSLAGYRYIGLRDWHWGSVTIATDDTQIFRIFDLRVDTWSDGTFYCVFWTICYFY